MKPTNIQSIKSVRPAAYILLATVLTLLNVRAADETWLGNTSANWNTAANWSPASVPVANDLLFFDAAGSAGAALNNDILAGTVFQGIYFTNTASAFTFSGNAIGLNGGITNASANAQVINNNVVLNGNSTLTNIGSVTINGVISGVFSFTENSTAGQTGFVPASPLYLNGANTFSGNMVVSGGALWITNANALGSGIKTNIIAGGGRPELHLNGVSGNIVIPTNITLATSSGAGSTTGIGVGTLVNDAGDNRIDGIINLVGGGGDTRVVVSAGTLTLAGKISPNNPNRNLVLRGAFNGTVSGEITDGSTVNALSSVDKRDTGTWTLTGTNNHTGATTVNGGVLKLGHSSALGFGGLQTTNTSGTTVGSGFTLDLNGMSVNEPITIAGGGITNGGALANYSGTAASVDSGIAGLAVSALGSGSGFSAPPTVAISGTGSGATATASLGITTASITAGALGDKIYNTDSNGLTTASFTVGVIGDKVYSVAPDVIISGGGGSGATATAVLNTSSNVSGINIVFCGTNYTTEPSLALSGGTVESGTTDTTFIGNTNQFTKAPTVTISGGIGAIATPVISFGLVTDITLTAAGTGFTNAPTVTISGGVISGTTDTVFTGNAANFCVGGLAMTAGGNGYTGTPTVTFNGSPATVTPTLSSVVLGGGARIGGAGDLTVNAVISESGVRNLTKTGVGKTTLLGANTFSGILTVEAGALWITNTSALGTGTKTNVITGSGRPELHLNGVSGNIVFPATVTFQTSSGAGVGGGVGALVNEAGDNVINGNILAAGGGGNTCLTVSGGTLTMAGSIAPTTTARFLYLRGTANGTINGVISNGVSPNLLVGLVKLDAGTWTLAAANTYGTNTSIGGGTLLVNGSLASGGTTTVSNTATLGGSGTINAPAIVRSGGTIKGGNASSSGTLTVANTLTLGETTNAVTYSQFLIAAGGKVSATTLAVNGTNIVNILDSSLTVGTNTLFTYGGGSIGGTNGFAGFKLGTLPSGVTAQLLNTGSAVRLGVTSAFTVNTNSPVLTNSYSGGVLTLAWPADRLGWRLQAQTNNLNVGLTTNWSTVPGSTNVTSVLITNNPANPTVFFRLVYP
jgi:autotransporter-associated beta strand protein